MAHKFRNPSMVRTYAACVDAFNGKHGTLFAPGMTPNKSNSLGAYFWRGYDNDQTFTLDVAARKTLMYAAYCAGRDCAAA